MPLKNAWKINFFCRFAPCFSPFHAGELGHAGQAPPGAGLKRNFADRLMDFTIPL
jgi:hypothetical protein